MDYGLSSALLLEKRARRKKRRKLPAEIQPATLESLLIRKAVTLNHPRTLYKMLSLLYSWEQYSRQWLQQYNCTVQGVGGDADWPGKLMTHYMHRGAAL